MYAVDEKIPLNRRLRLVNFQNVSYFTHINIQDSLNYFSPQAELILLIMLDSE
jgi:hypothetical protein